MLVALFKSLQRLRKLGDPSKSTATEPDHVFLTENTQPENIITFWKLTDLLWIWQKVIKGLSLKTTFLAFHYSMSYWNYYIVKHFFIVKLFFYIPKWPRFHDKLEILLKSSIKKLQTLLFPMPYIYLHLRVSREQIRKRLLFQIVLWFENMFCCCFIKRQERYAYFIII